MAVRLSETPCDAERLPDRHHPTPNDSGVLAVIVSYNGLEKTAENVAALRAQVSHIHIVDNGSDAPSLSTLDRLERQPGVTVERLVSNKGIGHALNRGVQRAREIGVGWLLTMDQDSVADASMISAYRTAIARHPDWVCLAPGRQGTATGALAVDGVVGYAITSGNLVRMSLFDEVGLYDEGLFIDCIDFDFSLRVRRAGYEVHRIAGAAMRHQLGEAIDVPRFARKYFALHSPSRRYFMYRNFMYMIERHGPAFPLFMTKLALSQLLLTVLIGFFDPEPLKSYRAILRGLGDYIARREGPPAPQVR